jgi:dihydrofolate reductase
MNAIFAVDAVHGFGADGTMPWPHSSVDLKRFRDLTTGHTVIMGSGTWHSKMPTPLPNRRNIVLSSTLVDDRCDVYRNINHLNMNIQQDENVFVIGGAVTLWKLRPYINRVYLTTFKLVTKSTVILRTDGYLEGYTHISSEDFVDHTFDIYERT